MKKNLLFTALFFSFLPLLLFPQPVTDQTFTNSKPIIIPATPIPPYKADRYPSSNIVSGLTGTINKITVTFEDISRFSVPDNYDILLVGPAGQNVVLMSDVGGTNFARFGSLTFDNDATTNLPDNTQILPGTYKPTNVGEEDNWPSPAPAPSYTNTLSAFNGTDPNGQWELFVVDDGEISSNMDFSLRRWDLTITTNNGTSQFVSSDPIFILKNLFLNAIPNPSTLPLDGLRGVVKKLTVTLHDITIDKPENLSVSLSNAAGVQVNLITNAGGSNALNKVDITFDDDALAALPDDNPISSGTYKTYSRQLSNFNDLQPNGTWYLYVYNNGQLVSSEGSIGSWSLNFTFGCPNITFSTTSLPSASVGNIYNQQIFASGGIGDNTYSLSDGTLPSGLTLSSTGVLSGTSVATGAYSFKIRATDQSSCFVDKAFTLAVHNPVVTSFSNNNVITIPQSPSPQTTAEPYPAIIKVSQFSGVLSKVNVILTGHVSTAANYDILLQGPNGQKVVLMSDVGGVDNLSLLELQFDDDATGYIPDNSPLPVFVNVKPTNNGDNEDSWPGIGEGSYGTLLSVFKGESPIGDWKLFVVDDKGAVTTPSPIPGIDIQWQLKFSGFEEPAPITFSGGRVSLFNQIIALPANPYPSEINVANLAGDITKVEVTLKNINSNKPGNLDVLLVGPEGQSVVLISDAGGSQSFNGTITLDDYASGYLSFDDPLTSGTFKPSNPTPGNDYWPGVNLPANSNVLLSIFNGTNPNGKWRLYVITDEEIAGDGGLIGEWSLKITTAAPYTCPQLTLLPGSGTLTDAVTTQPYNQTLTVGGGTAPYVFSVSSGILPAGITLSQTGTLSGVPSATGNYTFAIQAVDANQCTVTSNYTINVNQAPSIVTCPNNILVNTDAGSCNATVSMPSVTVTGVPVPTVSYRVNQVPLPAGYRFQRGNTIVEVVATNGVSLAAVCQFTVTVLDEEKPVFTPPPASNVNIGANCSVTIPDLTAALVGSDNCGTVSYSQMPVAGEIVAATHNQKIDVLITANDGNGNTASHSVGLIPKDLTAPVITVPADINVSTDEDVCFASGVSLGNATATDNCAGNLIISNDAPEEFDHGVTVVTWTAVDVVGNISTATQRVTVKDLQKPVITCPENSFQCANSTASYKILPLIASDNCGSLAIAYNITGATTRSGKGNNASGKFNTGISTIKWTVTDADGNVSTCQTTVTINSGTFTVSIPDAKALTQGVNFNTVYPGYAPAEKITLNAQVIGATGATYLWSNKSNTPSITVSPTANTTYTVTVIVGGCSKVVTKEVKVINVKCGAKLDKVTVCTAKKGGGFVTSCVTPGTVAGYLSAGGYLGTCVTPPITSTKSLKVIEEPTEVQNTHKLTIKAAPNPSSNYFTLYMRSVSNQPMSVNVTDVTGRLIEMKSNIAANGKITFGFNYRSGIYIVSVIQGTEKVTLKVIRN